jgi:hypothetical protein
MQRVYVIIIIYAVLYSRLWTVGQWLLSKVVQVEMDGGRVEGEEEMSWTNFPIYILSFDIDPD